MSEIRTVDFNALPRGVRERFVAITKGTAGPPPAFSQKTSTRSKVVGLSFLFVLLALGSLFVVVVGFGDYTNGLGVHDAIVVVVFYVPVLFLTLWVLLTIVTRLVVKSPYPFEPGRYLFPTDFVDARDGRLRIVPTQLLTDFNGTHMHTNGAYTHTQLTFTFGPTKETFTVRGQDAAQAATNAFWDGQRTIAAAVQAQDWNTVGAYDPFFEARRTGVWEQGVAPGTDPGPRVKTVPALFRWRAAIAAALAIFACPVVAVVRNLASDEVMFSRAAKENTEYALGAYIENGWRHVDEARLAQPIAAFAEAKEKGTVSEMRRVLKTYPGSSVESDARAELHELYSKTLRDFRSKASTADSRLLPFMERLIAYMEKNDTSTVRVVFSPPSNAALADADATFASKFGGAGKIFEPISPHFDEKRSSPRETAIVSQLNTAFATIFPTDVLTLTHSESASSGTKDPSIAIAYTVGPSGDVYTSDDEERVFVGIDVGFTMKMVIPDDMSPFDFSVKVSPPDRFRYSYAPGANQAEAAYDAMTQRAFDEFTTKLQGVFFRSVPGASSSR